jgi:hypothetical protein
MLLHPYQQRELLVPYQGTRMLQQDFGLVGIQIHDGATKRRIWTIQSIYAPLESRVLSGIRTRLVDNKNFVGFLNQRDLEVLLGEAQPGDYCPWLQKEYADPSSREWCGVCSDEEDLLDDLHERELMLRAQSDGSLIPGQELYRRICLGPSRDVEELHLLVTDGNLFDGICPDPRLDTISQRWSRIERNKVRWEEVF